MASGEARSGAGGPPPSGASARESGSTAAPAAAAARPPADQPDRLGRSDHPDEPGPHDAASVQGPAGEQSPDGSVLDRTTAVAGRRPGPFTPRQLARLDEALTMSSRETGVDFSVYVGDLEEPTREHAERLHAGLGGKASNGVLLAVSPGQRVLHIVTGEQSKRRLPDRSAALAALSMRAAFSLGDLIGGIVNGLRMLSDQAGHTGHTGRTR
ncbi:MAG TPA: DUF5130 family protein [Mycobacteriales bacterium]|nr:DUF5130 family protein [Mycobacteriales bacterium]